MRRASALDEILCASSPSRTAAQACHGRERDRENLAGLGDSPGKHKGEACEGVDILLDRAEPCVDRFGDVLQLRAGVSFPAAVLERDQKAGHGLIERGRPCGRPASECR